ncbi:Crp/Fnr family transcriptional regulator [Clostridium gasigenes]|uniref:Crp/Fnr family transcriptional regulator n=1 Tax=Clostridium gasigenes TaxID=94869 RepID=A0A7X0SC96_9CLOT|nr:Crp/Fnr family transcriptional regulator [Clostridium gasigenes]MBB6713723.1 Crp/Fnr family transcriptional regulator [Clostridium gasigenes]MBU3102578.1 Crp/Fnr family transcriptional regulator [Clostridium gasigenes]MBU3134708.1 Crp/Fnr family transcriptional regulator [Clostridium gasigenes]NKF08654.1 Crp/Fnr family transcriptional regulator [Clostridium gasigenes]QSW18440.1 Crp/Fnr family transcriptional regulator [Clostridium gasigenes]
MENNYCGERCSTRLYAQEIPIFDSLSSDELNRVVEISQDMCLKKGETLFLEGDLVSKLFIISDGIVKITKNTGEGKEQIINVLTVGDFFGESNILGNTIESNVSAITVKDTQLCTISRKDLEGILYDNPSICLKLLAELSKRLVEVENLTKSLSSNDPEARIGCMLLEFADKYGKGSNGKIEIDLPLNREGMANYCGIARETLSRKLTYLEREGILEIIGTKKIVIKNVESLELLMI